MKILMVCQYYWPDNFLINEIAEDLVKRGNQVTVLTGLPDYATTKVPKEYKWGKRRKEEHNGVKIIRVPIIARRHGFFFRVLNYLSFYINSSIYAKFHKLDFDVIYAYQLAPVLMVNAGLIYQKKTKKKLFTYVLDLWPDQMKIWHVGEKNPIFKLVRRYCRKAYGRGDVVAITSKPFEDYLVDVCKVDREKIAYLPQFANRMEVSNKKEKSDTINFIFAGNIGQQQNMKCMFDGIAKMKTNKKFLLNIYGEGTSFEESKKYVEDNKLTDKIKFFGRVPKEELNNVYPKMDAFILTLCSDKEIGFVAKTVPAKLQGYMSAGKPIFASIDGGANGIIKESKCGAVVPADDSDGLARILDDFVENPSKYKECGRNAIEYFDNNFEKKLVMDKLEKMLKELINNKDK